MPAEKPSERDPGVAAEPGATEPSWSTGSWRSSTSSRATSSIVEKLSKSPPTGIIRLSEALRLPIHKTRYSLHLLEREGVIQPSADGAVVTEKAREFWTNLDKSLDRMTVLVRQLKERVAEHDARPPPGRKGY